MSEIQQLRNSGSFFFFLWTPWKMVQRSIEGRILLGEGPLAARRGSLGHLQLTDCPVCRTARLRGRGEEASWLWPITQHPAEKVPVVPSQASHFLLVFFFSVSALFLEEKLCGWIAYSTTKARAKYIPLPFLNRFIGLHFFFIWKFIFHSGCSTWEPTPTIYSRGGAGRWEVDSPPAPQDDGPGARAWKQCSVLPWRLRNPVQGYSKSLTAKLIKGPRQASFWPPARTAALLPHQIPLFALHKVTSPETQVARGWGQEIELYFKHRGWLKISPSSM